MQRFDSAEDCKKALCRFLGPSDSSPFQEVLLDALAADCREPDDSSETSSPKTAFGLRLGKWIIRDTDLQLYDALASAMIGLFATNLVLRELSAASVAALVIGTLKILRTAHQAGTWLTERQVEIVLVLEANRGTPLSVDSMMPFICSDPEKEEWDAPLLKGELEKMRELPSRQGFVSIVECNEENEWLLGNV